MSYILYTLTGRNNSYDSLPKVYNKNLTDRAIYIILSTIILKKIKGKKPGIVDTAKFWNELAPENYPRFDRSLIRNELRKLFDDCVDGNILIDFIELFEIQKQLQDNQWEKIAEEVKQRKDIIEILANITPESRFCRIIEDIKLKVDKLLSRKNFDTNGNIFNIDDYCDLEPILSLDFKLLSEFTERFNLNIFAEDKSRIPLDELIEEADLIVQQNTDIEDLLSEKFIPLEIENKSTGNKLKIDSCTSFSDFKSFINLSEKNQNCSVLILGESGSGKSIIGLKLCFEGLKDSYHAKFINLERYNTNSLLNDLEMELVNLTEKHPDKPFVFFLDGLENLSFIRTKKSFLNFLQTLLDDKKNIVIISSRDNSQESDSIINSVIIVRYAVKLSINPLSEKDKSWVKTPLERVILDEIKGKAKSRGALYYSYIHKILEKTKLYLPDNYSFPKLKDDVQKIAFLSLTRGIKLEEFKKYGISPDLESILKDNKILRADKDNFGEITFTNNIFRDFLTAGYLISVNSSTFESLVKKENFEDNKWRYVMIFIAEWLSDNLVQLHRPLFSSALFHLRQQKEFDKVDELIRLIPDSELEFKIEQNYELTVEKATSAYYRGKYLESIRFNLGSVSKIINLDSMGNLTAKLYNLMASCLNDLYIPSLAIKIAEKGLEYSEENQKPRLMGNIARAYLKSGELSLAEKYFNDKKVINNFLKTDEILRDEADLVLLNTFKYKYFKEKPVMENIIKISFELIKKYQEKEFENDNDDSGNKIYVYRNISYLLPEIIGTNDIEYDLSVFINEADALARKDHGPYGVILLNTGKYFYLKGEDDKAFAYFKLALENFEKGYYRSEIYITSLYLYLLTGEKTFLEKSSNVYNDLKNEANLVKEEINQNSLLLGIFGMKIADYSFILKDLSSLSRDEIEKNIRELIIF